MSHRDAPEPDSAAAASPTPEELLVGSAKPKERLGPWLATAICGNDITSSCLYVSGIAIVYAGALAPLALLLAAGVLYLYRKIYTEVVEALPLDGGAYNCLLNCTRKFDASFAACLTLLSYLATAVISAKTAVEYLKTLLPQMPVMEATAAVLVVFALLTILGITDSARVALAIFVLHLVTLVLFILWVFPTVNLTNLWHYNFSQLDQAGHWSKALFFGFCGAMLGVSGFESSANYVEQQQPGVFRKTLKNMWMAVTFFNPIIALVALGLMTVPDIIQAQDDLLARLGFIVGGHYLGNLIVVDAFLVLSGAVLTSYVGVSGLVHRMTLDQCFPQFLLWQTRRGSYPLIAMGFMVLCVSILYLTKGQLLSLAGVYTISFLGVMTLFAVGNILLKVNRKELKRTYRAGWITVLVGALATLLGIVGNLIIDVWFLWYFAVYFVPAVTGGILMYLRIPLLRGVLMIIDNILTHISMWRLGVENEIAKITNVRVVLFIRLGRLRRLVKAFSYIDRNETSQNVMLVRFYTQEDPEVDESVQKNLSAIREIYPHIRISYQGRQASFSPESVDALSRELRVPKNMMFMGSLTEKQDFSVQDLGGVRVIF
jgi:amino acid transporter